MHFSDSGARYDCYRLMEFATTCNTYIEMSAPWKLAKDPSRSEALDHVLFALAESLRIRAS